jgi:hypothetical protein
MRSVSSPVRTLTAAGSILMLCLASVQPASAATAGQRAAAGPVCDPQTTTLRKLARLPKSFGGPLKRAPLHLQFGLTDPTARMLRGTPATFGGDEAVIQNDAPAARIDEDGRSVPSLRPLGMLSGPAGGRPRSPAFIPRSPRGPPLAA